MQKMISAWCLVFLLLVPSDGGWAKGHVPVFIRTLGTELADVFIRITDISGKIIGFSNSITGCIRSIIDRSIIKFSVLLVILGGGKTREGRMSGIGQERGCVC